MSKVQELQAKAAILPEQIAAEVLDFLEFVTAKRSKELPAQPKDINRFKGAFKGRLSSSSEFSSRKSDEIQLEG